MTTTERKLSEELKQLQDELNQRENDCKAMRLELDQMHKACKRALPWLGKMIADKAHLNSVAPNDCIGAMEQLEAVVHRSNLKP